MRIKVFDEITATMRRIAETMNDRARHAARPVHAKSHGLLKGELTVLDNLAEPLRQGLFKTPANYPVIIRLSTNPGDILPDSISTPRGMAVKVIGINNAEMLPGHEGCKTQDFVCVNAKVFQAPDASGFLKQIQTLEKHSTDSEALKKVVSVGSRFLENALEAVGGESATLKGFGHPQTHILGETFCSQVPIRYGDYIAKICISPASENLKVLTGKHVDLHGQFSGLRDAVVEFFKTETAEWEINVQLCTDLKEMPIEDASVEWPETKSPYVPVGRITIKPQNAYSPARRVYVDELLSFSPWHGLAAHQPLGSVMRARKKAYPVSSGYRHRVNVRSPVEPDTINNLPD
jgi:catalase